MTKKSYAKVNIFLKITGKRGHYHEIASRFVRVKNLYDTVSFEKYDCRGFELEGDFGCKTEQNTIYKAYIKLKNLFPKVEDFFASYKVVVDKKIPEFAGLGGGSSNCATFMIMVNEVCNLGLSKDQLSKIALEIGADVPFFIYEYDSANVTGIGEIVKKFEEESLEIRVFTPKVQCDTSSIFKKYREKYYLENTQEKISNLFSQKSIDIFNTLDISEANDLYLPALDIYNKLVPSFYDLPQNSYFSGSGSSFFYFINKL